MDMVGISFELELKNKDKTHSYNQDELLSDDSENKYLNDFEFKFIRPNREIYIWQQTISLLQNSLPCMLSFLIIKMYSLINLSNFFNLQDSQLQYLIGFGLSNSVFNILFVSVVFGFNGALDTVISQTQGKMHHKECGDWLNRAIYINMLMWSGIFIIAILLYKYCDFFNVNEVGDVQNVWSFQNIFSLLFLGLSEIQRRFLNNINIFWPSAIIQMTTIIQHVLMNMQCPDYFFTMQNLHSIDKFGIIYISAMVINLVLHIFYYYLAVGNEYRMSYTATPFQIFNWYEIKLCMRQIKLGLSSTLLMAPQWWFLDMVVIQSYQKNNSYVKLIIVIVNLMWFLQMIPYGLGQTISTQIGHFIGSNEHVLLDKQRDNMYKVSILLATLELLILCIINYYFGDDIYKYVIKNQLVDEFMQHKWLFVAYIYLEFLQAIQLGIARGMGIQTYSMLVNVGQIFMSLLIIQVIEINMFYFWICSLVVKFLSFISMQQIIKKTNLFKLSIALQN